MTELHKYSALELGNLVNRKQISTREVLDYFRERIEARNPSINAIVYTKWDDAYREADTIQAQINSGYYAGPFAGALIALKDFLPSKKGWINTHGGVKSLTRVDEYDSEFYKACKKLGAIAIGKTNAPPFGFSGACLNKLYGQTQNPFNVNYNSGGSSGGSAISCLFPLFPAHSLLFFDGREGAGLYLPERDGSELCRYDDPCGAVKGGSPGDSERGGVYRGHS